MLPKFIAFIKHRMAPLGSLEESTNTIFLPLFKIDVSCKKSTYNVPFGWIFIPKNNLKQYILMANG